MLIIPKLYILLGHNKIFNVFRAFAQFSLISIAGVEWLFSTLCVHEAEGLWVARFAY